MGEVAAAANDDLERARQAGRLEAGGDEIVEARSAGGQQDRAGREGAALLAGQRDLDEEIEEAIDPRGRVLARQQPLIAADAGEFDVGRGGDDRLHDLHRVFQRAAAGAPAGKAALQYDAERTPAAGRLHRRRQTLDAGHRVDERPELEVRIARHFLGHIARGLRPGDLVGEQDAIEAVLAGDPYLLHGGERDGEGAVRDLPGEELRRHGGLAVRRDSGAGHGEEAAHIGAVALQRGALQHGERQGKIFAQHVPALPAHCGQRQRPGAGWKTLGAAIDKAALDPAQIDRRHPRSPCPL